MISDLMAPQGMFVDHILEALEKNPNFICLGHDLIQDYPKSPIAQALVRKRAAQNQIRFYPCHHFRSDNKTLLDHDKLGAIPPISGHLYSRMQESPCQTNAVAGAKSMIGSISPNRTQSIIFS